MINIYKKLIINYIENNLSPNVIQEYASNNNFNISNSESIIIYNFIKRNYLFILNGDDKKMLELKELVRDDLYQEIMKQYSYYKDKFF